MAGERNPPDAIVVTGVGLATSLGLDAKSTWGNIAAGRVGIGAIPAVEPDLPAGSTGGQAPDLPDGYCAGAPREARYLRWVIEQALAMSRPTGLAPTRIGLVLGTTLHGIRAGGRFLRGGDAAELASFLAGATVRLAIQGLGVEGPTITTCSACSSSLGAVALGVTLLESGQVDAVIAGGYDAIGEYVWAGFNSLRLVASGPVRPFARDRGGMKIGEGFGVMILERRRDAELRGARASAVIEGWGESADAHHLTQPHPEGEGAAAAMKDAIARAGCRSPDVAFVAAHATATPDNDASEYRALKAVFGSDLSRIPVIGFKSYLGHTLGGAGAVELILALQALEAGTVPPCANVSAADVEFEGMLVAPPTGLPCRSKLAMTNSLGFGGANTSVVLSREGAPRIARARPSPAPRAWITGVGVILPGISGFGQFLERASAPGSLLGESTTRVIEDVQLTPLLNIRRVRRLGPSVKLMLAAASDALTIAGLPVNSPDIRRSSAILASTHGSSAMCYEYYGQIVREGVLSANPVLFAEGVPNAAAAHLSTHFGLRGGCQTFIGTRTAGLDALGLASLRIRTGAAELVLVGASEEVTPVVTSAYEQILDQRFMATPGAVALIVESTASVERRRGRILGEVTDFQASSGAPLGVAQAVGRVASQLDPFVDLVVSANHPLLVRAERLGLRRSRTKAAVHWLGDGLGETFSVGPLLGAAWAMARAGTCRVASIAAGFDGGAAGIVIDRSAGVNHVA